MTDLIGASFALDSDNEATARSVAGAPATRLMYDTSDPQGKDIGSQVAAWYLPSFTPHAWTPADRAAQSSRWQLPIFVPDNPATGQAEGARCAEELRAVGWPTGTAVMWDLETNQWAGEVAAAAAVLQLAGYHLLPYGSASTLFANPPAAGYVVADWTGQPHLFAHAGVVGTQYVSNVLLANGVRIDASLIVATVPLRDMRPPPPPDSALLEIQRAAVHLIAAGQSLQAIRALP